MATPVATDSRAEIPALGPERPVVWPPRTRARLPNGLEIVLVESHAIPKFTGELFFRSGNAAASTATPGLASLTSAVARTGTSARTSRQIEEDLRRMGADLSSGAGMDTSVISFAGLSDHSEDVLRLVAELATQATFPADEFERERRQLLEGVRIERTTPGFLAGERMRKVLFGAHPYAAISPTEAQVEAFRREQLVEFYKQNYRPEDALFIAVGDFQPDAMLTQITGVFGGWSGAKPAPFADAPLPELSGRRVYFVHLPGAVQAQVVAGNRAITRQSPDWLRYTLANSIYGGAFNSRLVMNIREQKGYTYSPRSSVHSLRRAGYFTVSAAVRNDVVAASLAEIFYELDRIRALPVGDDELADARNYLSGIFSLGLATQDGLAGQLASVTLEGLPEDYLEMYRQRIRALTADDVLSAARTYFDSANMQIVVVGDREHIGHQAALFGPVEFYDQQGNKI